MRRFFLYCAARLGHSWLAFQASSQRSAWHVHLAVKYQINLTARCGHWPMLHIGFPCAAQIQAEEKPAFGCVVIGSDGLPWRALWKCRCMPSQRLVWEVWDLLFWHNKYCNSKKYLSLHEHAIKPTYDICKGMKHHFPSSHIKNWYLDNTLSISISNKCKLQQFLSVQLKQKMQ